MKKRYIFLIILIVVFLLLFIPGLFLQKSKPTPMKEGKLNCSLIDSSTQPDVRDDCFLYAAIENKDPALCREIKLSSYNNCISLVAQASQDVTLCNKLTGTKDPCITAIAILKNDSSLCNRVTNNEQESCLKFVKDIYLCDTERCYSRPY